MKSVWWCFVLSALVFLCQRPTEASANIFALHDLPAQFISGSDSTLTQPPPSGKVSRRAKAAQRRMSMNAPGMVNRDTSRATLEAIRALPRDSSARLAQFMYVRKDKPAEDGTYHKPYPMFLPDPPIVKHQTLLDSTKWIYRLRETVGDHEIRLSTEIPLEEYSALRLKQAVRQNWETLTQSYQLLGETKTTLGDVFGKITKIEIPVPKNPIFSIFGKNQISMTINGAIDIHAGFRNTKSDLYVSSALGQSQSTPDFKQEIQVNVKGEIGDKLKIDADWNTQRTFEYENQLHVKYQGYEDELVQSVEAGNVSLPTNSSFISGGSALFGIMAKFQIGPLRLTTVTTQKKGQVKELAISGGGQASPIEIRPSSYSRCHFFIDTSYIKFYEKIFQVQPEINQDIQKTHIREIEVWVSTKTEMDPAKYRNVLALMDQAEVEATQRDSTARRKGVRTPVQGQVEEGKFIKLDQSDFDYNPYAGIISLRSQPQDDQAVAVYYMIDNSGAIKTIGQSSLTQKDSLNLILKLVRPTQLNPTMQPAWKMMLKNRYSLGGTGIDKSNFDFHIDYQLSGGNPQTSVTSYNVGVMEMLGLDQFSADNSVRPDMTFDYLPGITIDEKRGEIMFPTVEPFDTASIYKFFMAHNGMKGDDAKNFAETYAYGAIYDKDIVDAVTDPHNLYYMRGTAKTAQKASYSLGFNIVEGSVQVIVDGQLAVPGVDYTVDYISSQVVIRNQAYLSPGRNVQIKYEANDMFQLASKSLLGARGEFNLGKNSSLGFTIMNYSQQSLSDKVRLGEEPISNMIMGIDGGTTMDANWLTNALNYLPGIKTTAPSQIAVRGEVAYMVPNPNTRTSPIGNDGGKGVAYIDDFEGARQIIPLGVIYSGWKDASAPWFMKNLDPSNVIVFDTSGHENIPTSEDLYTLGLKADTEKIQYKGKACWFNLLPSDVSIPTIWGERKSFASGEGQVMSLDFYFHPEMRGQFNYGMNLQQTIGLDEPDPNSHKNSWAGMQHILGTSSTNLVEQNVAFIELWINVVQQQKPANDSAKLNIDLGYISEDVIPNRTLNTEDGLDNPLHTPRGIMNASYDWGLDTMSDAVEQKFYEYFWKQYPNHPEYQADPSGDNWTRLPLGTAHVLDTTLAEQFEGVNGTQGNFASEDGHFPDTEDLNRNGKVDRLNSYFEYEIPLDTTNDRFKQFVTGFGLNHWFQLRIPLSQYNRSIGQPTFTSVEGVRVWVTGAAKPLLFRIVDFNLVGNQWQKRTRSDTSFDLSVVNYEDDPLYKMPDDNLRTKDLTRPDQNLLSNEQSLNLIVRNLQPGFYKEAVKFMTERPLDMFNYHTLKLFVHGETGENLVKGYKPFGYVDTLHYDAEMFLHFGDDTSNYYEYRAPVEPGWEKNNIVINFSDLTSLKAFQDSANQFISPAFTAEGGRPGAKYRVRGNPRLDRIQFISIGIQNSGKGAQALTGELWVDELRLTNVDDTHGWAYKVDANIKLADIGTIAFSLSQRDPYFHGLEDHFGSRNTSRAWSLSSSFAFERLLPESWNGSMLSFSYSHSESINRPLYVPGTDILVENLAARIAADTSTNPKRTYKNADDVRAKSEDMSITDSYALPTVKLNIPSRFWLVTETINKMMFGYSYTQSYRRDASTEYANAWSWAANFKYGTQFNPNNYLTLGSLKFFYTPQSINFGASLSRAQSQTKTRLQDIANDPIRTLTGQRSMDFSWQFFQGGLFDFGVIYNVNVASSLSHLETDQFQQQRPFTAILRDIFFSDRLIDFGIDQNYSQGMAFNTKVTAPQFLSMDRIFTPNFRYSVNYSWTNNIQAGPLGQNAGWAGGPALSLDVNLRPITDAIWSAGQPMPPAQSAADTSKKAGSFNLAKQFDNISRILFKNTLFDFEKFSFNFTQSNSSQNTGIYGYSNGFANIFARVPLFQSSTIENGPSFLYQLGLVSDPSGRLVLKTKGTFPFITSTVYQGIRDTSASNVTDAYTQNNQIAIHTSRPLWEGATLQLDWKVGWTYNENRTSTTDSAGNIILSSIVSNVSGDINRSFISLPFFNTNLENVNTKYNALKQDLSDSRDPATKLSQAFEQGLEAMPWLNKILGALAPRANWSIHWDGLEKISFLSSIASRISLDHAYTSEFRRRWQMTPSLDPTKGETTYSESTTSETIMYGFAPLIGVNITFKDFIKGNLSASFRYGTTTSYDLAPSSQNVSQSSSTDISFTGTYGRQGFEIPFFGVSLMNNIDINFTYGYTHNSRVLFDFNNFQKDGMPMEGSGRTSMEPRIRYTLSERVTASVYYRYTRLAPDDGGSQIPGSTTNEGGLDVHVLIQ